MSARDEFVKHALSKLGSQVLWNADGPQVFDCSGLVCWALLESGGPDLRATHNAQKLSDETPSLATFDAAVPLPGDLAFYGRDSGHVTHVAIWMPGAECLSADGATSRVTDLTKVSKNAIVRLHGGVAFRGDFLGVHRFIHLDAIDKACR